MQFDDDTAKAKGSNHNSLLIQYLYTEISNSNDNPISGCIEITCKNRFQEFYKIALIVSHSIDNTH